MTRRGTHTRTTTNKEGASDTSHNAGRQAPSVKMSNQMQLVKKGIKLIIQTLSIKLDCTAGVGPSGPSASIQYDQLIHGK